jgi:hypothetical protein
MRNRKAREEGRGSGDSLQYSRKKGRTGIVKEEIKLKL